MFASLRRNGALPVGHLRAAVLAVVAFGVAAVLLSSPGRPARTATGEAPAGSGALDGMVFVAELGPRGAAPDVEDRLVFADGLFVSEECERRCGYSASPYYVRHREGAVEFVSETRCRDSDAVMTWRGVVDGDTVRGAFTWTSERWYWSIEKEFEFAGTRASGTAADGG